MYALLLFATLLVWSSQNPIEKRSWVTDFITDKLKGANLTVKCKEMRRNGQIPSADQDLFKHSDFGFPHFDESSRQVTVKRGVTLSNMFGFRQPIKIGSRDYLFAGSAKQLLALFDCFRSYNVIGSSLNEKGHWVKNSGSVKIQLSNLSKRVANVNDYLWEMVFKMSFERIIRYLKPVKIIKDMDAKLMGREAASDLSAMKVMIAKIREWLPASNDVVDKILEIYAKNGTLEEKVKEFIKYIKAEESRKDKLRQQWVGWDNVSKDRKILVTLTMYAKPENRVRSTFNTGRSTVTVKVLSDALRLFLDKHLKRLS